MLDQSVKRRIHWHIKDRTKRTLLTSLGMIRFAHTRETKESAYLIGSYPGFVCPYPTQCGCQNVYSGRGYTEQLLQSRRMPARAQGNGYKKCARFQYS